MSRTLVPIVLATLGLTPSLALADDLPTVVEELVAQHGEEVRPRLERGVLQVAALWREEDGDSEELAAFVRTHFAADEATRDAMFSRLERTFEQLDGLLLDAVRQLRMHVDLDAGLILPFDRLLAGYAPGAHLSDDLFANRLAFVVLLNFPLTTLEERLEEGREWSRREWAEARLASRFGARVPAEVSLRVGQAGAAASAYVAEYNVWMHHLVDDEGTRLFPEGLRLISHWNLRDEIRGRYSSPDGLAHQRTIQRVMERIVDQSIPAVVIDNPRVDWNPFANTVAPSPVVDFEESAVAPLVGEPSATPEPGTRYRKILDHFAAARAADPFYPAAPNRIARSFDLEREIPEERVREIFESVLSSELVPRVAAVVAERLGRPLEPFDIWYDGFRSSGDEGEDRLSELTRERYPTADAFADDIPRILEELGFGVDAVREVAAHVEVHASRGAGHAFGAGRRGDPAYLRTRVEKGGMDYKGYNIAVHELGHNVEQVLSLHRIDHTLLAGVPNTAFTEALAFVFQNRDRQLLGLDPPDAEARALKVLDEFWGTFEIAGVALVDVAMWHWMYAHPDATPLELRDATVATAQEVWNRYYAPVFGTRDSPLLGIYSHMISYPMYLPNYPLGHLIAFQIQEQMDRAGTIGPEFERMATIGQIAPDLWMIEATGAPVGSEALLAATERALQQLEDRSTGG